MQWRSCREEKRELKRREGPQREERRGEVGEGRREREEAGEDRGWVRQQRAGPPRCVKRDTVLD